MVSLRESEYRALVSEKSNFVLRALPVFAKANSVLAVSIDLVSGFWISNDDQIAKLTYDYISCQPENTKRLFVLEGPEILNRYTEMLDRHYERYGQSGGVYVCSADTYRHIVVSKFGNESSMLKRDFAYLKYDSEAGSTANVATLAHDHFTVREEKLDEMNIPLEGVEHFFQSLDEVDPGEKCGLSATDSHFKVLRWKLGQSSDESWTEDLKELFGHTGRCIHAVSFSKTICDSGDQFFDLVEEVKSLAAKAKRLKLEFQPEEVLFGENYDHLENDGESKGTIPIRKADNWPYMFVFVFASEMRMSAWYQDLEHSRIRRKFYELISEEIRELYRTYEAENLSAEERQAIYGKIEAIASKHFARFDYVI